MNSINRHYPPALYISGPMKDLPGNNYPRFNQVAAALRAKGWRIENPAEHFGGRGFEHPRHRCLATDVLVLIHYARGIVLLEGWEKSEGAKLEAEIGVQLCYDFYLYDDDGGLQEISRSDIKEKLSGL